MNILLFIDSLGSGGAQRQCVTLARLLKLKGNNVSILCYRKETFFLSDLEKDGIPVFWIEAGTYFRRMFLIRKFIRKGIFTTVISFLDTPNFLNCFAAIGGKRWTVITSERSAREEKFSTLKGMIFAWIQRYSDFLVCNSHRAKDMWIKYYPHYQEKIRVIYNLVMLPNITTSYLARRSDKLHVVVAASFREIKNPVGLIQSLSLLNSVERKSIVVNWYGEKNDSGGTKIYDETMALIRQYKLQKQVFLNAPTKEVFNVMYEADVIALFSKVEGMPNAILEGMSLGKPIIMSRVSDYEVLVDSENGFLCDWNKPETIRSAISLAMKLSEKDLFEMGRKSKIKAEELFSEKTIIDLWLNLLRK